MVKRQGSASTSTAAKRRATSALSPTSVGSTSSTASDSGSSTVSKDTEASKERDKSPVLTTGAKASVDKATTACDPPTTPTPTKETAERATSIPKHVQADVQTRVLNPSTREPSHDGTVILPPLARPLSQLVSGAVVPLQSPDAFPVFKAGNVIIRTDLGTLPTFQLHSAWLSRHSPWFAHAFQPTTSDTTPPSWFLFTIDEVDGKVNLVHQRADGDRPNITPTNNAHTVTIKLEEPLDGASTAKVSAPVSPNRKDKDDVTASLQAYTQILGTFYNIAPDLPTTSVGSTLLQSEALIQIASSLDSLHLIRPHIISALTQYRQALFLAIKSDPARWIQLAIALQDRSIYTEALVHLVGVYPCWPKNWLTKRSALPEAIQTLVRTRSAELDTTRMEIERNLLLTSIPYGQKKSPLNPADVRQTETWIAVQVFRDQLAQRIDQLDQSPTGPLHRGRFFRSLAKGTLASLEVESVRGLCKAIMPVGWHDLGEDLVRLKAYAAEIVKEIAANELMVDPDANEVGYLTCVKVRDADVPWLAAGLGGG